MYKQRAGRLWVHLRDCFASGSGTPQAVLIQGIGGWLSARPQCSHQVRQQEAHLKV